MLQRAGNFISAVAAHVAAGLPESSVTEAASRLGICQQCPGGHFRDGDVCALCGCSMSLKVTWREQQCPEGYW
jgi:hypothetical protein